MAKQAHPHDDALGELRAFGLAYPEAHTKSPWPGHLDLAVRDKTFAYLSLEGEPLGISCKLRHSANMALSLSFTAPTGYGLGKSGWVSAKFAAGDKPPIDLLKQWIDESYRAQAPKRLVATLDATSTAAAPKPKAKVPVKTKAAAKATKPAAKARTRR